jgi:hypothetical protein
MCKQYIAEENVSPAERFILSSVLYRVHRSEILMDKTIERSPEASAQLLFECCLEFTRPRAADNDDTPRQSIADAQRNFRQDLNMYLKARGFSDLEELAVLLGFSNGSDSALYEGPTRVVHVADIFAEVLFESDTSPGKENCRAFYQHIFELDQHADTERRALGAYLNLSSKRTPMAHQLYFLSRVFGEDVDFRTTIVRLSRPLRELSNNDPITDKDLKTAAYWVVDQVGFLQLVQWAVSAETDLKSENAGLMLAHISDITWRRVAKVSGLSGILDRLRTLTGHSRE